jgi:uncharacterized RDD family membrane protein YckC
MDEQTTQHAPISSVSSPSTNPVPAAMHKRFLNFLIDYYMQGFILIFLYFLLAVILQKPLIEDAENPFLNLTVGVISTIVYYTFFETLWGKTPGKFISRTKVISSDGKQAPFAVILKRSLLRLIPFEGFSWLTAKNPSGWHDKYSASVVIDERDDKPTTKSGLAIFGLMILEYITAAIAFIVFFILIASVLAAAIPKDLMDKISPEKISPTPVIHQSR